MNKSIREVLVVAFFIRLMLLVVNMNWFVLPESGRDDTTFESLAWQYTSVQVREDPYIESSAGYFIKFGTLLYSAFGRVPALWGFILVILGTATVYNIYKSTYLLWQDKEQAIRVAWFAAFFPELAILSAVLLREVVIHFFLSLAVISLIRFWKYKRKISIYYFIIYIVICTTFHSAMIAALGGLGLVIFLVSQEGKKISMLYKIVASILVIAGLVLINYTGWGLSKFGGSFGSAVDTFSIRESQETLGSAGYPDWMRIQNGITDTWKLPVRFVALLFSPAIPFLVKKGPQSVGLLDALFYILIFYSIYKNRKFIKSNRTAFAIFIISMSLALIFSLGTSNFGTAIRHRAKLLPLLLVLAVDFKALNKKKLALKKRAVEINNRANESVSIVE